MPNPVPLATKEEEDRRAWVTAHHEVVRLVKDCFGDRFSNNEIFDRLKISRRTGYRALGNDERIGKAPGRKPKISEDTIRDMIKYIEEGGCADVGNVWKHLADKFAPDCNPKTVQDAVKKSGFKNYQNQVKLDPLLNQHIPDTGHLDDTAGPDATPQPQAQAQAQTQTQTAAAQIHEHQHQTPVMDPPFQAPAVPDEVLRHAISTSPPEHIRWVLTEVVLRFPDAANLTSAYLCPFAGHAPVPATVPGMAGATHIQTFQIAQAAVVPPKRRLAICRRCGQQYERGANTMETRECLYHKGSPQKISNDPNATSPTASPEAYIWSCCGGNGMVRGCFRAMHTTKKKRKYAKKRDAADAGLDDDDGEEAASPQGEVTSPHGLLEDSLQELQVHSQQLALEGLQEGLDEGGWKGDEYSQVTEKEAQDGLGLQSAEARMQHELQRGMQQDFSVDVALEMGSG